MGENGWLKPGDLPYPSDGEMIYVLERTWGANVAEMVNGTPEIWDLQCGSQTHAWPDDIVLWQPMPKGWRGMIE